jgi:hypothetical protein
VIPNFQQRRPATPNLPPVAPLARARTHPPRATPPANPSGPPASQRTSPPDKARVVPQRPARRPGTSDPPRASEPAQARPSAASQESPLLLGPAPQYNNAYSANCFVPNANNSTVLTSVSQNLGIYNRSVGFSSNMQQPFYQEVACSTPPSPLIGIGVPCEPVPNVYSNVPPQHTSHVQPSLPELQSHTYVASVLQPNSLEPSQFYKDLIDKILIECGFKPRVSLKENKIDSDMNDNSIIETEENNTCSSSIILEDTHGYARTWRRERDGCNRPRQCHRCHARRSI